MGVVLETIIESVVQNSALGNLTLAWSQLLLPLGSPFPHQYYTPRSRYVQTPMTGSVSIVPATSPIPAPVAPSPW